MSENFVFEELGPTSIAASMSYSLKSKHVDQTFQVDIARPTASVAEGQALPVVYVLDGNDTFGLAAQTARLLQDGTLPPTLVVGVGYRFDQTRPLRGQFIEKRARDYTPTTDHAWLATRREALAKQGADITTASGGAASFLAFIEQELKPFIASRYPVLADDQTLTGMSLGGLFTLYALFQAPENFARYAAFSPSLWWDDRVLFRHEAALAERVKDMSVRLFLSVGAHEEGTGSPYLMVSNLEAMKQTLEARRYPNLKLTHHVFSDETHGSVYPASFSRGLRTLFG